MKKRILSLFLALVLCIGLTISASAVSGIEYVIDEVGYLSTDEVASLNRVAASLYDAHGVGIFFIYTTEEYLQEYDVSPLVGGLTDYVVMMENDTNWFVHYGGLGEQIDLATEETLRAVYDSASTYVGGVNDFLNATAELFPVTAESSDSGTQQAEAELEKAVPGARVLRMDMDTTGTKNAHSEILEKFRKGEADILLGTQMVTNHRPEAHHP